MKNWQVFLILFIGVIAVSTAAIFIRLCQQITGLHGVGFSLFLAASRLIITAFLILPAWGNLGQEKCQKKSYFFAILAGGSLAVHFACWITSLSYTSIAVSTTLVTTNPLWVTIISRFFLAEKFNFLTYFGIIIALVAGIFIANQDVSLITINSNPLLGNSLALIAAFFASLYLILGREAQNLGLSIKGYITITYSTAAILLFPLPFLFNSGYLGYPNSVYFYLLLMAIIPQLIGHTSFNFSLKFMSPTLVSLAILFEPIGSTFLAWIIFKENISLSIFIGAFGLLLGVAITIIGQNKNSK